MKCNSWPKNTYALGETPVNNMQSYIWQLQGQNHQIIHGLFAQPTGILDD